MRGLGNEDVAEQTGINQLKAKQAKSYPSIFFKSIDRVGARRSHLLCKQAPTLSYAKTGEAGKARGFIIVKYVIEPGRVASMLCDSRKST